jgi:hypothetical protein
MNELLESFNPSIELPVHDTTAISNVGHSDMDIGTGERKSKPESKDKLQAAQEESGPIQPQLMPLAGALEDDVPTVRVDKCGHAYLSEAVFPKHDEV